MYELLRSLLGKGGKGPAKRDRTSWPELEMLEDRTVPSVAHLHHHLVVRPTAHPLLVVHPLPVTAVHHGQAGLERQTAGTTDQTTGTTTTSTGSNAQGSGSNAQGSGSNAQGSGSNAQAQATTTTTSTSGTTTSARHATHHAAHHHHSHK
jgi:hypothetical protein